MPIQFEGPAILVSDIKTSRTFYENILGQEILADFGQNIPFKSGFSIWQADHATGVMFSGKQNPPDKLAQDNFELYFETDDIGQEWSRIEAVWTEIIHPVVEAPWGQRGFRLRDPDGHVVEISETLAALFRRLLDSGMTPEDVAEQVGVPVEMVQKMTGQQ